MRNTPSLYRRIIIATTIVASLAYFPSCRPKENALNKLSPSWAKPTGKRTYGEIKPVILPIPDSVLKALDATDVNGQPLKDTYIYFRSLSMITYRKTFDAKDYMSRMAEAFVAYAGAQAFAKEADTWTIQMNVLGGDKFVVMSCSPTTSADYVKTGDLNKFIGDCDFLMINDVIISNPEERIGYLEGRLVPEENLATPEKPL